MADMPLGLFGFAADMALPYAEQNPPWLSGPLIENGPDLSRQVRGFAPSPEKQVSYRPSTAANFSFMLQLATWTPDEFVMLLLGRDFRRFNWHGAPASLRSSKFAERFLDIQEVVGRAFQAGQLPERGSPDCFVLWAWERGVAMPDELKRHAARLISADAKRREEQRTKSLQAEYVSRLENVVVDLSNEVQRVTSLYSTLSAGAAAQIEELEARCTDEVAQLTATIEATLATNATIEEENCALRDENERLWELWLSEMPEEEVEQTEVTHDAEIKFDPRREKTRDRIAVGLAMKFCAFDPRSQRAGANKRVVDAIAEVGITITERTVGTTLKAIHAELASAGEFIKTEGVSDRK